MKTSTMHFLLFSLLVGAMPLGAQHDTEQDWRREPREQLFRLPHIKGLPDGLAESPAPPMSYDGKRENDVLQRLPKTLRERLAHDWDLSEIAGLAPAHSKHRRYTDKPAPSSSQASTERVTDGSALQMVSSDSVVVDWIATYTSGGATALVLDGSSNVYVTGGSVGSGQYSDYATVKYNASGVQQWVARYNGPGNLDDQAFDIAVDGSGNVYVTARSLGSGTIFEYDYATVKYNASGVQQWVARYNGPGNFDDIATAIALDGSGNVYVTGRSSGSGTSADYATVKYNASGVQQWVARYNGPGNDWDRATALAVDGSGNVYVTGPSWGSGTSYDYATVKYNASGVQQWVARYKGPGNSDDIATALAVDSSGNVYVTGRATFEDGWRYTTIKYRQITTGILEEPELPREFVLYQNYPNPFNPTTNIRFELPRSGFVSLSVFNLLGQEVATVVNEVKQAGRYEARWDAQGLPGGVYVYRLSAGDYSAARKMILLK